MTGPTFGQRKIDNALVVQMSKHHRGPQVLIRDTELTGFFIRVSAQGRVSFGVAYTFNGCERRMSLGTYPELSVLAARKLALTRRAQAQTGIDPLEQRRDARDAAIAKKHEPTLSDLHDLYIDGHVTAQRANGESIRTASGVENEKRYWGLILARLGPKLRLSELTRTAVEKLHRDLSEHTPANANRVHASLRCALGLAVKAGWLPTNPAAGIARNPEHARERYLTIEEIARLRSAVNEHADQTSALIIWFALLTGARRGEILKARWQDIDLKTAVWTKPRATTKQRRLHRVPLSGEAVAVLRELRSLNPSIDLIIPGNPESVLTRLRRAWARIRREAALGDVRFHDLRHAHASILISRGCSLAVVGAALGHTQAQTTMRYAHLMDDALRDAANIVASVAVQSQVNLK
jgi:integrase